MEESIPEYQASFGVPNEPPNPYITTIDELRSTQEALRNKETIDKSTIFRFVEPDVEELKKRLLQWTSLGFPDTFVLFSVSITPPLQCSDGEVRSIFEYVNYLLQSTLYIKFQELEAKLLGMSLSYSFPTNQICMHVSKV